MEYISTRCHDADFATGLGLAVVARIVEQLGGQLRVDSRVDVGSRFSFLLPFATDPTIGIFHSPSNSSSGSSVTRSRVHSSTDRNDEIDNLVQALSSTHLRTQPSPLPSRPTRSPSLGTSSPRTDVTEHASPKRSVVISLPDLHVKQEEKHTVVRPQSTAIHIPSSSSSGKEGHGEPVQLRILIVEVRLTYGHISYVF